MELILCISLLKCSSPEIVYGTGSKLQIKLKKARADSYKKNSHSFKSTDQQKKKLWKRMGRMIKMLPILIAICIAPRIQNSHRGSSIDWIRDWRPHFPQTAQMELVERENWYDLGMLGESCGRESCSNIFIGLHTVQIRP